MYDGKTTAVKLKIGVGKEFEVKAGINYVCS